MCLKGYDYSLPGIYFVTLVSSKRKEIFGQIIRRKIKLTALGKIVNYEWFHSNEIRKEIQLFEDEFVIMPNHLHGIVNIFETGKSLKSISKTTANLVTDQNSVITLHHPNLIAKSLGAFITGFKSSVTKRAKGELGIYTVWQRNYYDHIIRSESDHDNLWHYINDNPRKWIEDKLHPNALPKMINNE